MNDQTRHTPGPWFVGETLRASALAVVGDGDSVVCEFPGRAGCSVVPDARLISAAPKMLAALYAAEDYLEAREDVVDGDYGQPEPNAEMTLLREVRAAIAKATAA